MTCTSDLAHGPGRTAILAPPAVEAAHVTMCPPVAGGGQRWWSHEASLPLALADDSATLARRHASAVLTGWGLTNVLDEARIVVTELVANAEHATRSAGVGGPIGLRLLASPSLLAVEVWDLVSAPPRLRPPGLPVLEDGDTAEPRGNGLVLVDDVSLRWGHAARPDGGKVVFAILKL